MWPDKAVKAEGASEARQCLARAAEPGRPSRAREPIRAIIARRAAAGQQRSRPAWPSSARRRVVLVGEYYNQPPRAGKIVFHCRNCRDRLTLFLSRFVVQESRQDRPKVSSRRQRPVRRRSGPARPPRVCSPTPPTGAKPRKWRMRLKRRKWR